MGKYSKFSSHVGGFNDFRGKKISFSVVESGIKNKRKVAVLPLNVFHFVKVPKTRISICLEYCEAKQETFSHVSSHMSC